MKHQAISRRFTVAAILSLCLALCATGQVAQVGGTSAIAQNAAEVRTNDSLSAFGAAAKPDQAKRGPNATSKVEHSAGVDEVLKMMQAGVSPDVIRTYVENSPIVYTLSANDIIALKQHAVPDDITTAMLKRGARLMQQLSQLNRRNSTASLYPAQNPNNNLLDPESYEYFQYYYLLPRTLAAANQRLLSSYAPFGDVSPYRYGAYGMFPFRPFP